MRGGAERAELTPQQVANAELGIGIEHPLIDALDIIRPHVVPFNLEYEQITDPLERQTFIRDNYGMLVDAVEGSGDFTLEPEEMIAIWSKAVEVLPHGPRVKFAETITLSYATQGIDDEDVKKTPRTVFMTGRLPDKVRLNANNLGQVTARVNEVEESYATILRYFNVVDNPIEKEAELSKRIEAGDQDAQAELDRIIQLGKERKTPVLQAVSENFGSALGQTWARIQLAEFMHKEVARTITPVISNEAIREAEAGVRSHPVVDVLNANGPILARLKADYDATPNDEKRNFVKANYGFLADAIEAAGPFDLEPLDIVAIWARARALMPRSYSFPAMLATAYAIQQTPNHEVWKGYPRYYLEKSASDDLAEPFRSDRDGMAHFIGRMRDISVSLQAFDATNEGVDVSVTHAAEIGRRLRDTADPDEQREINDEFDRMIAYDNTRPEIIGDFREAFGNALFPCFAHVNNTLEEDYTDAS
ncbi:MAG: hypothetical protein HY430_04210 [Candidatus Levybacteria bacterium]|nr:hypothetical protein [Candidatus Levybacteria bacterium]